MDEAQEALTCKAPEELLNFRSSIPLSSPYYTPGNSFNTFTNFTI